MHSTASSSTCLVLVSTDRLSNVHSQTESQRTVMLKSKVREASGEAEPIRLSLSHGHGMPKYVTLVSALAISLYSDPEPLDNDRHLLRTRMRCLATHPENGLQRTLSAKKLVMHVDRIRTKEVFVF